MVKLIFEIDLYIERNYYTADVTSYDYHCPISETEILTEKYFIIKKNRLNPDHEEQLIWPKPKVYPTLRNVEVSLLANNLDLLQSFEGSKSVSMESIGQGEGFGYTLYETTIECVENLTSSEEKIEVNVLLHSLNGRCHFFCYSR